MSCSEGDSMALGEGPKVFMLAEATLFIRIAPSRSFLSGCANTLAGPCFYFNYYSFYIIFNIIIKPIKDKLNSSEDYIYHCTYLQNVHWVGESLPSCTFSNGDNPFHRNFYDIALFKPEGFFDCLWDSYPSMLHHFYRANSWFLNHILVY